MKIVKLNEVVADDSPEDDSLNALWGLTKYNKYDTMGGNAGGSAESFGGGLRITDMKQAVRDENRVNVFVNGRYAFSLEIAQVVDLGVKVGKRLTEAELNDLKKASEYGKLYQRTLEWVFARPRSVKETRDHLYKKLNTPVLVKKKNDDPEGPEFKYERVERFPKEYRGEFLESILAKLIEKGYVNDQKFAEYFVENRNVKKGISGKRLKMELAKKGVAKDMMEEVMGDSERDEETEIMKMIKRKRKKYNKSKLIVYLCRQGFDYELVKELVNKSSNEEIK